MFKNVCEMTASPEQEIFQMPDVRVIGCGFRCSPIEPENDWGYYWKIYGRYEKTMAQLTSVLPLEMPVAWSGPDEEPYGYYIVGKFCPAGTPVPKDLHYRDLPASLVVKGITGDEIAEINKKLVPQGFKTNKDWNTEIYFGQVTFRWFVPVIAIN